MITNCYVGSGKSTLVSILSRLINPTSGCVTIGGVDITQVPLSSLRAAVHVLPQEPLLFEGTLRQNLDPDGRCTDDEQLWDALDACGLREHFSFSPSYGTGENTTTSPRGPIAGIESGDDDPSSSSPSAQRPRGLNTHIQTSGANLSTGQSQLLCIARAIIRCTAEASPVPTGSKTAGSQVRILIFDEATAALDPSSDQLIQEAVRTRFPRDTTMLCVAHRIETLAWMDRVVVMDDGRVVEVGGVGELLERDGSLFRRMAAVGVEGELTRMITKVREGSR